MNNNQEFKEEMYRIIKLQKAMGNNKEIYENYTLSKNINCLPCPRFEILWVQFNGSWETKKFIYSLVIPLSAYDSKSESDDGDIGYYSETRAIISIWGGYSSKALKPVHDGKVEIPYIAGLYDDFDRKNINNNIPIYAVCGKDYTLLDRSENE